MNFSTASTQELYEGIHEFGTKKDRERADQLLSDMYDNAPPKIPGLDPRDEMMALMATVAWHRDSTPEADEERRAIARENLK